jgi:hypothetical protein
MFRNLAQEHQVAACCPKRTTLLELQEAHSIDVDGGRVVNIDKRRQANVTPMLRADSHPAAAGR